MFSLNNQKGFTPYHFRHESGKGFTLIETLIYIALFGIILTGVITAAYPLITGADRLSQRVTAESEAAFVLHKIAWALSSWSVQSVVGGGNTLTITFQVGGPYNSIAFAQNANAIEMNSQPLTASRIKFSNFSVSTIIDPPVGVGNAPHQLTVSFTADGESFSQTYNTYYP